MPSAKLDGYSLRAENLFNITGLVAVITGGGSGKFISPRYHGTDVAMNRHREDDGHIACGKRGT